MGGEERGDWSMGGGGWQSGNAGVEDKWQSKNATRGVARAGPFLRQGKQALPLRKDNGLMERVGGKAASSSGRGRTRPESAGRTTLRLRSGQAAFQKDVRLL